MPSLTLSGNSGSHSPVSSGAALPSIIERETEIDAKEHPPRVGSRIGAGSAALFALLATLVVVGPARADFKTGLEAYQGGDYATAQAEWLPLAEAGMVEAQYNIGLMYEHGQGYDVDLAAAHPWYLKAAEGGYARAQYRVAEMYEEGEGIRTDLIQAHFWFRQAGDQRYENAKKRRRKVADKMTPKNKD
jgi:TPR repeat protein